MVKLEGKYLSEYNGICKYLKLRAKKSEALSDAIAGLFEIYSAAQENGTALEDVRGDCLSEYEHELLSGLPRKKNPFLRRYLTAACAVLIWCSRRRISQATSTWQASTATLFVMSIRRNSILARSISPPVLIPEPSLLTTSAIP